MSRCGKHGLDLCQADWRSHLYECTLQSYFVAACFQLIVCVCVFDHVVFETADVHIDKQQAL